MLGLAPAAAGGSASGSESGSGSGGGSGGGSGASTGPSEAARMVVAESTSVVRLSAYGQISNELATELDDRHTSVPNYKTWARSLTTAEMADMGALRGKIEGERVNITEGALKTYPKDFSALEKLSVTMNLNTHHVCLEYIDFMNEERRRVMQTINRTRARMLGEASKAELDNQLELDAVNEYSKLFEDAAVDSKEGTVLLPGSWADCKNAPSSFIDDPPDMSRVEDDKLLTTDEWGSSFREVSRGESKNAAEKSKSSALTNEITAGRDLTTMDTEAVKNVEKHGPSFLTDSCVPCKIWKFPRVGEPGFFHACKRLLAVYKEIHPPDDWRYQSAWSSDPLIKISQQPVEKSNSGNLKGSLAAQLFEKYIYPEIYPPPKKVNASMTVQAMKTDLLRCYPVRMGPETSNLNTLLQFVCWWHKNITVQPTNGVRSVQDDAKEAANCYQALCMPNLTSAIKGPEGHVGGIALTEYKWLENKRSSTHYHVRSVMNFMYKNLKVALDKDVLLGKPEDSVLLKGGGYFVDTHTKNLATAKRAFDAAAAEYAAVLLTNDAKKKKAATDILTKKRNAVADAEEMLKNGAPTSEDESIGRRLYDEWRYMNPPNLQ